MTENLNSRKKPSWLKISRHNTAEFAKVSRLVNDNCLHTICQSGRCPNQCECWSRGTATFMILGDICTRSCRFCATLTGHPLPPDCDEPHKLAESIRTMKLRHAVITSVTRDDLPDGGAQHWHNCIAEVKRQNPDTTVEVLLPDFNANASLIALVGSAQPDVMSHNLETVHRLTPLVRSKATYETSLAALRAIAQLGVITKTGMMVGLGETPEEVAQLMDDAKNAGCSILTIGQYLQPGKRSVPVADYITPEQFEQYRQWALQKGFRHVESAPLVRSSYHAEKALI